MASYLLDTNAINRALDLSIDPGDLRRRGELFVTHVQLDELRQTRRPERLEALLGVFQQIGPERVSTSVAVWNESKWDEAEFGTESANQLYQSLHQKLDARNGGKPNNVKDALIGVTALVRALTLVTNDRDLAEVTRELGGDAITFEDFVRMPAPSTMMLADEKWTPCSVHEITLSFLRSEWDKWPSISAYWDRRLVEDPVSMDAISVNLRASMLWSVRAMIVGQLPADTTWFKVEHIRRQHFGELRAINHVGFTSPADDNEIEKVALRKPEEIWRGDPPSRDWSPILFAHDRGGPFTILEANHRMTALAQPDIEFDIELTAYVGLSRSQCVWHLPDTKEVPIS
jgi:hypothetical protein